MTSEDDIKDLRRQIDSIDDDLLALVNQRAKLAMSVGKRKPSNDAAVVYRPEREAQIFERLIKANPGPLPSEKIEQLFREIISLCRAAEAGPTVATLGPIGTYSELATYKQFGQEIDVRLASSIEEVFRLVEGEVTDYGVVPVENSTEGGVNLTLDRLLVTRLKICGEINLRVKHCLLGLSEAGSPKKVLAHEHAFAQCQSWLDANLPSAKRLPSASNAEAARRAAEDPTCVAIAAVEAAKLHGLLVLHANIEDQPGNTTRFLVLGRQYVPPSLRDKTSIAMSTTDKPGALQLLLAPLSENNINMTRVESRPSRTGLWEYIFFVDFEGHMEDGKVQHALSKIEQQAAVFKILGSYPRSR